ncbi:glycosyltransferase family 4 protein [Methanolobus halotolerans]|uniref:Glycosyl transferase family 1 domain-containing protein n=1 Tax=Methanolobus halotolerans TaxID=2052935 RepID=A0A4E0QAB7_9EURY|nr:glycosyltransferase family 4 protein [Methanolobus halotolerans]TGC09377.1 hypothetical protein CUN85_05950 [Methanolobus halotolerans]
MGKGPQKKSLIDLEKKLHISENVYFEDFMDYNLLIEKQRDSKVFLMPSSREGFGISVIEAYACGVPVITVNQEHNAAQYLVSDGMDGFVVPLDEKKIAAGIRKLLFEENYEAFLTAARKKANQYDWEIIIEQSRQAVNIKAVE